jgi:hypothetical protein
MIRPNKVPWKGVNLENHGPRGAYQNLVNTVQACRRIDYLAASTLSGSQFAVVITLRRDFVGKAFPYRVLSDRLHGDPAAKLRRLVRAHIARVDSNRAPTPMGLCA